MPFLRPVFDLIKGTSESGLNTIFLYFGSLIGFSSLVFNITQVSARQALCPEHLLGRMNASIRFFVWGVMPIGALLAGAAATAFGIAAVMWVCAVGVFLSAGFVVFSPLSRMKRLPDAEDNA